MLTKIRTATLRGVEGYSVTVETDLHRGMPGFRVVGLADTTIKEAFSRIKPAIMNAGYRFPNEMLTVNLSPAGCPKEGSHFDLPIALGVIMQDRERRAGSNANGSCGAKGEAAKISPPDDAAFFGELSLDGRLNPIRGALPLAISARKDGVKNIVVPVENTEEVLILEDVNIIAVRDLNEVVQYVEDPRSVKPCRRRAAAAGGFRGVESIDYSQVLGSESMKRALTVAAAGSHGILMMGGPGCGKTMLAKRLPTILPELTYEEKLEITGVYSVAGMLPKSGGVVDARPFRCPHHTISAVGLTGGGTKPRPGELSLAHRGILFLDELGEFESRAIDAMRQPIEDGYVRINRNLDEIMFPSDVMLVAAANPCKCGYLWDEKRTCTCTRRQLNSYRRKLYGPFSDRIDLQVKASPVPKDVLLEGTRIEKGLSSRQMRAQVEEARRIQRERYRRCAFSYNGRLDEKDIAKFCPVEPAGVELMTEAYDKLGLTMRAYTKIRKVARTIADIEGSETIGETAVAEALSYRMTGEEW